MVEMICSKQRFFQLTSKGGELDKTVKKVLGCSVLTDVRYGVLHLVLFTAASEFKIGVCGANKQLKLPWQQ